MDAREVAEAISDGINRLVSLMQDDASDDDTKADIQRLIDALEALSSSTIMSSLRPSPELFADLRAIRQHLDAKQLSKEERVVRARRACAALGYLF